MQPRPVQRPCPIWIASNPSPAALKPAMLDRALHRVARLADGWMTVQLFPGALKANWTKIAESLRQEGRDPAAFPTMAYHNVNLNPDRQAALAETKRFLDEYYGPVFSPAMVESWTAAGTPDQCVEHLRALMRDGARTITLADHVAAAGGAIEAAGRRGAPARRRGLTVGSHRPISG